MKANEAPEKIYLHQTTGNHILSGKYYESKPAKIRYDDKIIEYTRTDTFIEKAAKWLRENINNYTVMSVYDEVTEIKPRIVHDFKKAMKGE